jgi:hypothetical protein
VASVASCCWRSRRSSRCVSRPARSLSPAQVVTRAARRSRPPRRRRWIPACSTFWRWPRSTSRRPSPRRSARSLHRRSAGARTSERSPCARAVHRSPLSLATCSDMAAQLEHFYNAHTPEGDVAPRGRAVGDLNVDVSKPAPAAGAAAGAPPRFAGAARASLQTDIWGVTLRPSRRHWLLRQAGRQASHRVRARARARTLTLRRRMMDDTCALLGARSLTKKAKVRAKLKMNPEEKVRLRKIKLAQQVRAPERTAWRS